MFSDESKDTINEILVLTKLSNNYELRRFDGEFYVLLQGFIIPIRIFYVLLCKFGLWQIRFSKADWFVMNKDLYLLWKELDIIPRHVTFYPDLSKEEAKQLQSQEYKKVPITVIKNALEKIDVEEDVMKFFSSGNGDSRYNALLYMIERDYANLAK